MRVYTIWSAMLLMAAVFFLAMPMAVGQGLATIEAVASEALDTDDNGLYDYLSVDATLNVTQPGNFSVDVSVYDEPGEVLLDYAIAEAELGNGTYTFIFLFEARTFSLSEIDGPYNVSVMLFDEAGSLLDSATHLTAPYNYTDFERPPLIFTPPHADYGVDSDGDGDLDILRLDISVNTTREGYFLIMGYLTGPGTFLDIEFILVNLTAGDHVVSMDFSGAGIYAAGLDGPYAVDLLAYAPGDYDFGNFDVGGHQTQAYNATEFQAVTPVNLTGTVRDAETGDPASGMVWVSNQVYGWTTITGVNTTGYFSAKAFVGDHVLVTQTSLQDRALPVSLTGDLEMSVALEQPPATDIVVSYDLEDWGNLSLDATGYEPEDNQTFRFFIDQLVGDGDMVVDSQESALFVDLFLQPALSMVPRIESTQDFFEVDGGAFQLVNETWDVGADLTGDVLVGSPLTYYVRGEYTAEAQDLGIHDLSLRVTYDTAQVKYMVKLRLPSRWVLKAHESVAAVDVQGLNMNRVTIDPLMRPSGAPSQVTISMNATLDSTPPQVMRTWVSPDTPEVFTQVTLAAEIQENSRISGVSVAIRDPQGNPLGNYTMQADGPSTFTYTAAYDEVGTYSYTVWAEDDSGFTASASGNFTVHDSEPPTAAAESNLTVTAGQPLTLDASNSTDNHRIVNYTWTFTDGDRQVVLYGRNPTYTFSRPGTYTITLTVTDAAGNTDTMTITVTVQEAPLLTTGTLLIIGAASGIIVALGAAYHIARRRARREDDVEPPPPNF